MSVSEQRDHLRLLLGQSHRLGLAVGRWSPQGRLELRTKLSVRLGERACKHEPRVREWPATHAQHNRQCVHMHMRKTSSNDSVMPPNHKREGDTASELSLPGSLPRSLSPSLALSLARSLPRSLSPSLALSRSLALSLLCSLSLACSRVVASLAAVSLTVCARVCKIVV